MHGAKAYATAARANSACDQSATMEPTCLEAATAVETTTAGVPATATTKTTTAGVPATATTKTTTTESSSTAAVASRPSGVSQGNRCDAH
jgi:hypothetical protein